MKETDILKLIDKKIIAYEKEANMYAQELESISVARGSISGSMAMALKYLKDDIKKHNLNSSKVEK